MAEGGTWPTFGSSLSTPLSCYLLEFQVLGRGMAFLSSIGTAHGTAPPCFVLRLCGFPSCGTGDVRQYRGASVPDRGQVFRCVHA